ncbi:purine catabolism regulator [Brevibacterium sanguinis]|uniref:Purine catabolism regulator n=3 Tax=Brevibacteriaceae TaxID=85019 RepID=A0A366INP7_9MICO|nr:purine catabolism regulator [Brevibacterium sanguinis]RBP74469.1 purine catabolism regulator [Brevibacterium celere]
MAMVTLGQLWGRRELALDIVVDPPGARSLEITIVHSSELPRVDEWLAGGEVLLTIGVSQDLSAATVADYVARLAGIGVRALGIGLGSELPLQTIPAALRDAARASGLALFGVPEPVPFVAVVDAFTRLREEESNRELTAASNAGRRFATALASRGPAALIAELGEVLHAAVSFVSPTGRGLSGPDAELPVRRQLIGESLRGSLAPRLLPTVDGFVEAVPVGDDAVRGWILSPAEASGSPRIRSLLLSTAAALLGLESWADPPRREAMRLFSEPLGAEEARREWVGLTGLAPVSRVGFAVYGDVRGESTGQLMADLSPGVVLTRAGSTLAVVHAGADLGEDDAPDLLDRVAEITGVPTLYRRTIPLSRVHHTWTVWRGRTDAGGSDLRRLLSAIDEAAANEFVDRVLGPMLASTEGRGLLETLRAVVAAGGARDAVAAALGVHRHTVRARIGRIERLLGRDLSRAETMQEVGIALELAGL